VQDDRHFLVLCRYVEANPVRAGLVSSGRDWQWSSLRERLAKAPALPTAQWPLERPSNWLALVDRPMQKSDAEAVRTSLTRDRPLGDPLWTLETAHRLGLDYTLRPRGRPRVRSENELCPLRICREHFTAPRLVTSGACTARR
jgi:putative transposase